MESVVVDLDLNQVVVTAHLLILKLKTAVYKIT